ncbi:CopD family protein [Trichlorobacter lovleyi]|uniref:Cytochrome b5 n=1 Tax=Trichlorobacter lovleyi (strain ATCC BAA-1151 / DSM 17278 / SZ) TaxID=398767 RepID=B3EAA4_TRIL1|nr:CopD family protein [Trichlorobacter lovleyi]ACD93932.1 cytochrome b5 [Trichlorobacter lovleyi SZ]
MPKKVLQQIVGLFLFMSFVMLLPHQVGATEEYAKQTAQACAICHFDPGGGGELTTAGKAFAESLQIKKVNPERGTFVKVFRLAIGYIHFLTAIFWFGTILYVHLILKPAYAASGLPRGELRVGIVSMIVIGVTGSILTYYRVSSSDTLFHTRFGILLTIKICLYLVMVLSALFVITVIGPRLKAKRKELLYPNSTGELTLEGLASYDGIEGRPAYFAFEGKIYDATHSLLWKQGTHMGRHNAGNDLTEALNLAPHGREKVTAMTVVGELIASSPRKAPLHERVFFFMAHMNLTLVFIIILILSLWRWG